MNRRAGNERATHELQNLRTLRQSREWDTSLSGAIEHLQEQLERSQRRLGDITDCWTRHVPPRLLATTRLTGLRAGVLQVATDSSAQSFELDRLLREGLLDDLRRDFRGTLRRIKVRVAPLPADTDERRMSSNESS